jgi:REP element-mobilizing transposase RayT
MPRVARCVIAGLPLHVVQRGINCADCFFSPGDYATYLRLLQAFSMEFDCSVHAYCLMTNHVHLLLTPGARESCALLMKKLGQCYVQHINHRLGRSGTLWGGRYKSGAEPLGDQPAVRLGAYRALCDSAPPQKIIDDIRKATRRGVAAGTVRRSRGRPGG